MNRENQDNYPEIKLKRSGKENDQFSLCLFDFPVWSVCFFSLLCMAVIREDIEEIYHSMSSIHSFVTREMKKQSPRQV
jgi:hypothetical protein